MTKYFFVMAEIGMNKIFLKWKSKELAFILVLAAKIKKTLLAGF